MWRIYLIVSVIGVIGEHLIFIPDGADLPAGVGPDVGAADVDGQDEQADGDLGSDVDPISVQGSDHGEDYHEELEERHWHDDKVDGCRMNLFVDLALIVGKS